MSGIVQYPALINIWHMIGRFMFFLCVTGVVAYDLIGVLKILKKEKWLTSEEYNNRLRHGIYCFMQICYYKLALGSKF
jgi:hypothetical protein